MVVDIFFLSNSKYGNQHIGLKFKIYRRTPYFQMASVSTISDFGVIWKKQMHICYHLVIITTRNTDNSVTISFVVSVSYIHQLFSDIHHYVVTSGVEHEFVIYIYLQ